MEGGGAFRDGDSVEGVVTVGSSVVIILCLQRVCFILCVLCLFV